MSYHEREPSVKRYRRDETADPTNPNPSIVVHVRNLSPKATEADLLESLSTFGPIAYATCIRQSRMALVEFETLDGAKACVQFASTGAITVGGHSPLFNYSTSQCIERLGFESAIPNKVVLCTISNVQYPIDADVMYQICSQHGPVLRIAVMHKSFGAQALVEYNSVESAKVAKHAMNGADIYSGCCTLKVEFAKPEYVKITRHDKDQRDFTVEPATSVDATTGRKVLIPSVSGPPRNPFASQARKAKSFNEDELIDLSLAGGHGCVMMVYGIDFDKITPDMIFNIFCGYGNVLRINFLRTKNMTGMVEMGSRPEAESVIYHLQGIELFGCTLDIKHSHQDRILHQRDPFTLFDNCPSFRDYTMSRNQRFLCADAAARNRITSPTNQLHFYNAPGKMDEEKIREILSAKNAPSPQSVDVFPPKSEKSSSGLLSYATVTEAMEALALCNHTPVVSLVGSAPYIVKLAIAANRKPEEPFDIHHPPPRFIGGVGGYRKRQHDDYDVAYQPRGGFRGGPPRGGFRGGRGRGDFGPPRGGFRGGRGRGMPSDY